MEYFKHVHFKGTFRDYQQRILDRADHYLNDGKINIVAAPGSGKTVLGLELIRRLGKPCIILSPTTAIRQQWGDRFRDMFLDNKADFSALFSNDLHNTMPLTSITYQALYSSIAQISSADNDDTDCSDINIFTTIHDLGIKTICLDEAHHLKNEWQKALEQFLAALDSDVKIISLTATPPYDSEGVEWTRYQKICGEIDEEIFVPELVGQNTLCPHQDYIYFNYPSKEETESYLSQKENAAKAVAEIGKLNFIATLFYSLNKSKDYERFFSAPGEYIALATLFRSFGFPVNKKWIRQLAANKGLPAFKMKYAEKAIQFLLDGDLLDDSQKTAIVSVLKDHSVYDKKKVILNLSEGLKRTLISSVGKLHSIQCIAQNELHSMGDRLRMLILTDYIKKESLSKIATESSFSSVNVVSIFETLRRAGFNVNIGVLSGSLIILPNSIDLSDIPHQKEEIFGTNYCTVTFGGAAHLGIDYIGRLFEHGKIQILIGTKSLLGEGWDAPCINSLILASFVGSFVSSNQMRGRAIRIDKNNPDKSANIWHLVTVEPTYLFQSNIVKGIHAYLEEDYSELISHDYDVLKRRFDAFMGPNYTTGTIESGIERITLLQAPYDKNGIAKINEQMLALSSDRSRVKNMWHGEVANGHFNVEIEESIPSKARVPIFTFWNFALNAILISAESSLLWNLWRAFLRSNLPFTLGSVLLLGVVSVLLYRSVQKIIMHLNPANSIQTLGKAVYAALCECQLISPSAKVDTVAYKRLYAVAVHLRNASIHDQNIFNTAMAEMLSPIENPRYLLIARNTLRRYNYELSFACPSILGKKKEYAEILAKKLRSTTGNFEVVFTNREDGRKLILKCRKHSYITFNEKAMGKKYKVSHWE